MQVGAYADGRPLSFEPATGQYDVGGAPITLEQLSAYDQHGQIAWLPGYGRGTARPSVTALPVASRDVPLTSTEYALFALAFFAIPYACVFLSSILYYAWKRDHPTRANQVNRLGFMVFGAQILMSCLYVGLMATLSA